MRGVICTVRALLGGGAPAVAGVAEVAGVPAIGGAFAAGGGARAAISAGVRRCMGTGSSASAERHVLIAATARSPEIRRTVIGFPLKGALYYTTVHAKRGACGRGG